MTVVALALSAILPPSTAGAVPPPPSVSVELVAVNGSGCAAKTASVAMAKGNSAFTVAYSNFQARAGSGATPTEFRKNCQINVRFKYPAEYTWGISKVEHHGSAKILQGANAVLRGSYYFAGSPSTLPMTHTFKGPLNDKWNTTDTANPDQIFYPPCGQSWNLNVNTETRVNKAATTELSAITMSPDLSATYHLDWRKCD
ncbi:DUF4360 domain-containing protein [Lentzea tibetensis]|nr:DUF4360 domain-containing protein [Lentzea tibetensis]